MTWLLMLTLLAEPMTLADALTAAHRDSPAAQRAAVRRDGALRQAELTRPRLRPDLDLRAGGEAATPQVRDPAAPNAIVRPTLGGRVELVAEQIVYHAGGDALDARADAAESLAAAEYAIALDRLDAELTEAWLDLLLARAGLAVADEGVARARSQLARVDDLLALEKVAEVDRLRAVAGLLEAQAAQAEAANGAALALANVNRLLGRRLLDEPIEAAQPTDPPPLPALEAALRRALESRPEMLALLAGIAQARAAARFARAASAPVISLTGSAAVQTSAAFRADHDLTAGVRINLPLSRADNRAQRDAAQADAGAAEAELQVEELRRGIELELRTARGDHDTAVQRAALSEARVAAAAEAHRVALLQYELQRVTFSEVQAALLDRRRAELDWAAARFDRIRAAHAYARAAAWPVDEWPEGDHAD